MSAKFALQRLNGLFHAHRQSILVTYGLTILENLFELCYPLVIGLAIDGLLNGSYSSLMILIGTWLAHMITGVGRHVYDTRTFTQIYAKLAAAVVLEQDRQGMPTSLIVARSALSREFVDFFERDIPQIITALFGFVGALVMLTLYDWPIALYCLLLLMPLWVVNQRYAHQSFNLNQKLNDQLENEVNVLAARQPESVQAHYQQLSEWRIRLSNAEAINWGMMEFFVVALFVAALIRTISLPAIQAGDIYAIVSYVWNYRQSLDRVPGLVQQLSRLQDIGARMR